MADGTLSVSTLISRSAAGQVVLTWGQRTEQEWCVRVRALLPLIPQITEGVSLVVLDVKSRQWARRSGCDCQQCCHEVEVVVHGRSLPEVIDLAQLHKHLLAGSSICLIDPELELGTCRRAEGGGIEVGQHSWHRNDLHPFRLGGQMRGCVDCQNDAHTSQRWRDPCQRMGHT